MLKTIRWFCPVVAGLLAACAGASAPEVMQPTPQTHEYTLIHGQRTAIPGEPLTLELTAVNDSRCPRDVQCVWAGHATVTLRVSRDGLAAEPLVIGSYAPPHMGLPAAATLGPYRFYLTGLTPAPVQAGSLPLSHYRATVRVLKLAR